MSKYNDEIFKALTSTEEKFRSAIEIAEHIDRIKRKLIKDYWDFVKAELNQLIKSNKEVFKVQVHDDVFRTNSKCSLILNNNKNARFIFEQLSRRQTFGLWINGENSNADKFNEYRQKERLTGYGDNDWWFAYKELDDDFSNIESLVQILPDKIQDYSRKRAKELFDFAVENKKHLECILKNCF